MSGSQPGEHRGGRQRGTRNKKSEALLKALIVAGCDPAEQIAGVLLSSETATSVKLDLWVKILPFCYPTLRSIDPDGYLTVEQAAGMLGAQAARFREVLLTHGIPGEQVTALLEAVRTGHTAHEALERSVDV